MSVGDDVRRLTRFQTHYLYSEHCPEPEDEIENSEDRRLSCEYIQRAGSSRYLVMKGETPNEYLTSSIWCTDLPEYR